MANQSTTLLRIFLLLLLAAACLLLYSARDDLKPSVVRFLSDEGKWFAADDAPMNPIAQIFDLGVVDANQDGHLDIFTSNHNYQQYLWIADGHGRYTDKLNEWGLAQAKGFPGWEQSTQAPEPDRKGLYIYWQGDTIHIHAQNADQATRIRLHIYSKVEVTANDGFQIAQRDTKAINKVVKETNLTVMAPGSGHLSLYIPTRGGPVSLAFEKGQNLAQVYIGGQKTSPNRNQFELAMDEPRKAAWSDFVAFSLSLQDRHAMVWADYNDDGQLDLFTNRGAMGGSLREFPDHVRASVKDELLVSQGGQPKFTDITRAAGIEKRDCSGRHAKWVDFNQDGKLDLFINCLDRGNVAGAYGKQLYEQTAGGGLVNVAAQYGLDLPQYELNDLAWLDVDNDGDMDLVTHENTGFYVYRQQNGRFTREFMYRGKFERGDIAKLKGDTFDYWQFDGKLAFGDFDNDGDLDIFASSKKGNALLTNTGGKYVPAELAARGLPAESVAAVWIDYDNDGRLDLHTVPEGLLRQNQDGSFVRTGMLEQRPKAYQAAIINWYDRDNDGNLDALVALEDNFTLWRWWQKPFKSKDVKDVRGKDDRFDWQVSSYRNLGGQGHWLQVNLIGSRGNPQAIGARVTLTTPYGRHTQTVGASEGSYLSQGHYRLYFGLGDQTSVPSIQVHWPDGRTAELRNVKANQLLTIRPAS
jgi:hypothetical protein